ncbi:MAG: STAS/SEC14 domain-containing protein [Terriglobales bacterium]
MLKITIVDTPTEQRIVLFGKLAGPWLGELQRVWEESRHRLGNRRRVVDINDVTVIDHSADALLVTMMKEEAEFVANGLVNQWLIQALKEGKTQIPVRALRPNTLDLAHSGDLERTKATRIAEGIITLAEVRALLRDLKDSEPPYRELIDARGAVVRLSSAEVQEIVELLRSLSGSDRLSRIAVVVSTDMAYGMMRMLQILVEDVCVVQPFRNLADAERWLRQ